MDERPSVKAKGKLRSRRSDTSRLGNSYSQRMCPRPVFEGNRAKVETSRRKEADEKNLRIHLRLSMIMMICVSPEGKEKVGTLTGRARIRQRALLASMCDGIVSSRYDCFDFS